MQCELDGLQAVQDDGAEVEVENPALQQTLHPWAPQQSDGLAGGEDPGRGGGGVEWGRQKLTPLHITVQQCSTVTHLP